MPSDNFKASTWQSLIKFDKKNNFFAVKKAVLIGLSGGADSVSLAHFVSQMGRKKHFAVFACHVNHGLRKNAARDAAFAKKTAEALGLTFILKKVDVKKLCKKEGLSTEHGARRLRYKALLEAAKKCGCAKIALAHHADDNAQTILLNILRGTKAKGLLGIPVKRVLSGVEIMRPFLCITRKEVLSYIKEHGLSYIDDETNFEDIYTRNWVRAKLLPLLESKQPKIKRHLLDIAADLSRYIASNDEPQTKARSAGRRKA